MNRRKTIQLGGACLALLSGCASTGTNTSDSSAPTPANTARAPLNSTTMLSVANANFHVLDARDIETNQKLKVDANGSVLAKINPDRATIDTFHAEMTALQMTVHEKFDQALQARLQQAGVPLTRYSDPDLAIAVRANGDVATLGDDTEAVIDVRVVSLGYRPIASAVALTPEAEVKLNLVRVSDSFDLAGKRYTYDWRDMPDNPRHYRCAPGDLFQSVDALMAALPKAAAVLDQGTMGMVDQVASEIIEVVNGNALA